MLALKIDPSVSDNLPRDIRDRYGRRLRRAAISQLWDLHYAAADKPKVELGWGVEAFFGPMGFGKTTTAVGRALEAFVNGYKVISINAGLLVGWTLADPKDYYLLLASGVEKCVVLVDEVHTLMSAYGGPTLRQREAIDSVAGTRKMMLPQEYISQNEKVTAGALKAQINWVNYPEPVGWEKWKSKLGDEPAARNFPEDCYIELHRVGPDPYEDRQGTVAAAHDLKLKGDSKKTSKLLWPGAVDSWMRTYWSFTPVTTGLSHDLRADAMRGRWNEGTEIVWSDELSEDEQKEIFAPAAATETVAEETPRQKAGRLLANILELMHARDLDPSVTTLPVARTVALLRDGFGWEQKEARRIIGERLDPKGSPAHYKPETVAGYYAAEVWEDYVIRQVV